MNYRHLFHAGNFADVLKHITLIALANAFARKETPYCYLETHAGAGIYDLTQLEKNKDKNTIILPKEYQMGADKIFNLKEGPLIDNEIITKYREILKNSNYPAIYPGSPLIMYHCMRSQDKMILSELHVEEYQKLKSLFKYDLRSNVENNTTNDTRSNSNTAIHHQDGYITLKALLPPHEKRGIIFIDPPYEQGNEWEKMIEALNSGIKKFSNGVFVVWYPIKDKNKVLQFKESLKENNFGEILNIELTIYPSDIELRLIGSGLMIINPPWQIEDTLQKILPDLWSCLSWQGTGGYHISKL